MRAHFAALLVRLICLSVALALPLRAVASHANRFTIPSAEFSCGGPVHAQAIELWEQVARPYLTKQIEDGLNKEGDVYVLYFTQQQLQSFVEMTRRCKDTRQIDELAGTLNPVFESLRPLPDDPTTMGWVCTGGRTCTPANKLLGKEVQLCSAQFLGLLGAVATDIAENVAVGQRTPAEQTFLVNAASAMAVQVNRWLSPEYFAHVAQRMRMTPADAKDGSSKYFFEDRDLWFMTTLSDLSELHAAGVAMNAAGKNALSQLRSKEPKIASMFDLFLKRITITHTPSGSRAALDQGYWRNYSDNKYALYDGAESPVLCQKNRFGEMQKSIRVQPGASYIDPNMGWDISHARRLVPALDTFVRNRANLIKVFGYSSARFDPAALQRAFANQIVDKTWNKDKEYPLFSNFWDGSNGWYRVGYENGTGECRIGQAPYSLAWSFATGGYPQWGTINDTVQALSRRLYLLRNSTNAQSVAFVRKYYPQLQMSNNSDSIRDIWTLAFLSSLVNV